MINLMSADIELRNSKGELIFAMKRKDKYPPIYYIFEKHEDKMTEEDKEKFEQAWSLIRETAAMLGFPLHDMREISEALEAQMKAIMETDDFNEALKKIDEAEGNEMEFIKDINFKVFDHAKGTISTLTVGVNLMDMTKDVGADG